MDRYKFRGKRLDNGEWVEGYYHKIDTYQKYKRAYIIPRYASDLYSYEVDPATVGQYTGLKDIYQRVEVFDRDVIYWEINNGSGLESYTAVVRWSEDIEKYKGMYKWLVLYIGDYLRGDFDELSTAEKYGVQVIGNEIDDPELLEG